MKWIRQLTDGCKQTYEPVPGGSIQSTVCSDADPNIPKAKVTTDSLAKDKELQNLLDSMKDLPASDVFGDKLGQSIDSLDSRNSGKPLFIIDYISRPTSGSFDHDDSEILNQGNSQLILRSAKPKLSPESVSLAQWIGANARIMMKLLATGKLSSHDDVMTYLQYVADFGDYAQTCELDSLMLYDHEYRKKQAAGGRKWGEDDIHLCTFYLRRKSRPDRRHSRLDRKQNFKPPRLLDNSGHEICRSFNASGCFRSECIYSHVCAICKDSSHSKAKHNFTK